MRKKTKFFIALISICTGAISGYLYYKYAGCRNGACPIVSNQYLTIIFGAVLGFTLINTVVDYFLERLSKKTSIKSKNKRIE
ncbi:MAG: hypothetical protein PHR06_12400 [Candidatus Cloacimonetes bacterium]|nr:hypothetical protein [Candidatus Cloacimonadota bacterium]